MRGRSRSLACLPLIILLIAGTGCRSVGSASSRRLTDLDREAIQALDSAFVHAWLRDDTTAVLALFQSDAVIFPPGSEPIEGLAAIRAYWWPTDGSHTRITSFIREIVEIDGTPELAYFRGGARLAWVYQKAGKESAQTSRSTDLVLLTRDPAGQWRISRQMWSQRP